MVEGWQPSKDKSQHRGNLRAASEPVTLPFRQQRPEDQETPIDTEKVQETGLELGPELGLHILCLTESPSLQSCGFSLA